MENTGTVTIGVDYYTNLVEESAVLRAKLEALERFVKGEKSKIVYVKDVAAILGVEENPVKIWAHVEKGEDDDN